MNILIIKLSAIGDVVHTLPSLAVLRRLYPNAHITWVIEEASSDLIVGHPYLNRIVVSGRKRWIRDLRNPSRAFAALREIKSFVRTLRDRSYDLVIDFHGLFKSALLVFLSGGKRKLGYDSLQELSGLFLNEKIPEDLEKHAIDRYLDFLRYLGAPIGEPEFLIPIEEANKKRIDALLQKHNLDSHDRFVAVNPIALWETKLWEEDRFAALCDRIIRQLDTKVVLTGNHAEGMVGHIQSMMSQKTVNLAGRTTLRDLAYLYRKAALLITTDSGPMHIAAAVGTPVIALFGPTSASRTGPYGEGHFVIRRDLACSPCFLKKCETRHCMKDISVEDVLEAAKKMLKCPKTI
jgi:3-deoxy-D-manno-octulosonic-acid transferase/heptosyltransferase-1